MDIDFNSNIIIKELIAWMDGGSVTLVCKNEKAEEFKIHFTQNVSFEIPEGDNELPGRLYIDSSLIEQRSKTEKIIIDALENRVILGVSGLEKKLLNEKINYIKSSAYLKDSERVVFYKREK